MKNILRGSDKIPRRAALCPPLALYYDVILTWNRTKAKKNIQYRFQKGQILYEEKRPNRRLNFLQKLVKITRLKVRLSQNITSFADIFQKHVLNIIFSLTFRKGQNMDKWPNHFCLANSFR